MHADREERTNVPKPTPNNNNDLHPQIDTVGCHGHTKGGTENRALNTASVRSMSYLRHTAYPNYR